MYDESGNKSWTCDDYIEAAKYAAATFGMTFFLLLATVGLFVTGEALFSNDRACINGKLHEKQHSVWVQTDKLCVETLEQENVK